MKSLSKVGLFVIGWLGFMRLTSPVFAAGTIPLASFRPSTMPDNTGNYFGGVITMAYIVALGLVFFYLIYGAISWITSSGDSGKLQTAKNRMIQAVVGLLVLACVWGIYTFFMYVVTDKDPAGFSAMPIPVLSNS